MTKLTLKILMVMILSFAPLMASGTTRIKDIVEFEGVRDNMLIGYGLVVGLKGTGDTAGSSPFTVQSLRSMLERLGVNTKITDLKSKNVAAVMVTATLPPFAAQGSRIDVNVSALGDSKSLLGGTLLVTPLMAADGNVYAVSQGVLAVGGFEAVGKAESITRGVPTAGRISSGAIIEREINFKLSELKKLRLSLRNPDLTTAQRISDVINRRIAKKFAKATDPATVVLDMENAPKRFRNSPVDTVALLTEIEQLHVLPDQVARVVIDEQSGVIVMGENVKISKVAVAQGNLTIRITERPQASQPNPFARVGTTVTLDRTTINVEDDEERQLGIIDSGVDLQDLVRSMNELGVGPRDMILILQAIKAAGALQADIEVI